MDFRSAPELAGAVLRVIEEPRLREQLESNAREAGHSTAWPNVARQMVAVFQDVAGQTERMGEKSPQPEAVHAPTLLNGGK